ncbi:hypothetical protein Marpi_1238 [Marinitoga piezophila KA3]|uniref:HTH merR-type domain-containing protein n=1 Tax=Marinitoga piezophila (strain DSM 14283 / JCM 11233 / KA3) TaxID=443254 RepID=H2J2V1_MARPK|nr:hypothetical protein Marpi_1238 [Marinitoga piezophila KA3]
MITIPYFCQKYNFDPDLLRKLVKYLNVQPITGDLQTRGMRFYNEKDLFHIYNTFINTFPKNLQQ